MIPYELSSISGKGKGLFTKIPLKKDQILFRIDMTVFKKYTPRQLQEAVEANSTLNGDHANYVGRGKYVIEETPAAFMNHSCEPNCCFKMHSLTRYDVIALCDIASGQELTHDYTACSIDQFGGKITWKLNCNCGRIKCRGFVTGDYFAMPFYWQVENYNNLPPSVKYKYRNRFNKLKKLTNIEIRKAKLEDSKFLARIHIDAWRHAYKNLVSDNYLAGLCYSAREEGFRRRISNYSEETFVAATANNIFGFVTLGDCRDTDLASELVGEIWGIYLQPGKWRMKLGTYLCSWAEVELAARGYTKIILWVFAENSEARMFYESLGYSPEGASKTLNPGKKLLAVRYIKDLK